MEESRTFIRDDNNILNQGKIWSQPMSDQDIRWIQRFNNFDKALHQLKTFIDKGNLNKLEALEMIHSFENTYELAWNTLKEFLKIRERLEFTAVEMQSVSHSGGALSKTARRG